MEDFGLSAASPPLKDGAEREGTDCDNDGYLDRGQWDYLTRTFDRADYFQDNVDHHSRIEQQQDTHQGSMLSEDQSFFPGANGPYDDDAYGPAGDCSMCQQSYAMCTIDNGTTLRVEAATATASYYAYDTSQEETDGHKERDFGNNNRQSNSTEDSNVGCMQFDVSCDGKFISTDDLLMSQQLRHSQKASISQRSLSRFHSQADRSKQSFDSSNALDPQHEHRAPTRSSASMENEHFVTTPRILEMMQPPTNSSPGRASSVAEGLSYPTEEYEQLSSRANPEHNVQERPFQSDRASSTAVSRPPYRDEAPAPLTQQASMLQKQALSLYTPDAAAPMITPLTAYNYFYRNERDTIVNGMTSASDPMPPSDLDFTPRKMAELLHHHWTVDPFKKKRQHRKTHGIIEFTTLSKVIAKRWKRLPEHGRQFYREVANVDQQRYENYLATLRQRSNESSPTAVTTQAPLS